MLFTGEQYDAKARHDAGGLYYLRARYYDPTIGRFLGRDPIPFLNRYTYVRNNPTNYVDPSGLRAWEGGNWRPGYLLCYEGYGCWVSDVLPVGMICLPGPPNQPLPCQPAEYSQVGSFSGINIDVGIELHNPWDRFNDFLEDLGFNRVDLNEKTECWEAQTVLARDILAIYTVNLASGVTGIPLPSWYKAAEVGNTRASAVRYAEKCPVP